MDMVQLSVKGCLLNRVSSVSALYSSAICAIFMNFKRNRDRKKELLFISVAMQVITGTNLLQGQPITINVTIKSLRT